MPPFSPLCSSDSAAADCTVRVAVDDCPVIYRGGDGAGQLLLMYNVLQFERHCGGAAPEKALARHLDQARKLLVRQLSSAEQSSQRQRFHDNRAQLRAKQGSAPRPAKYWLDEIEDDPGATHP